MKFVEDEQGNPVPDMPNLSIVTLTHYKAFVEGLDTFRGHDDDKRRKKNRQRLLLVRDYEKPEFTPRDLTQTSQPRPPWRAGPEEGVHRFGTTACHHLDAGKRHRSDA